VTGLTAPAQVAMVAPFQLVIKKDFRMIKRLGPGKRLSQASIHGNTVYLAGQVPDDYSGDIKAQTKQVLDKIDALLKEAGTDKHNILSATVWLPDISDRDAMNTVWDAWVPDVGPARACVESKLADPAIKVEIACIAAIS
jgi:enamine deaminase RidA (YjgF/YER057c/UK114 family)